MCATVGRSDGLNITLVGTIKVLIVDDLTAICQRNGGQIQ